ncbi:MAG: hypothetical protein CW691_11415 [Candidatus Bathyarchaeum sp.]|nr:MAG: hypothetical protein CW691_11415 [Candidatus Bathyarchaeum sp.]
MLNLTISDSLAPILFQIAIGGIGGFLVGYAVRKILKVALILVAIIFSLIFLAYLNVLDVDYDGLSELASNFVNTINPALDLLTPLLVHIPFIASFVIGLILGFRRD